MADPIQNSLIGARAQTNVPQAAPPQLNPNKVDGSMRSLEQNGMATAQAVNKAATNPSNMYAKGGSVASPPTPNEILAKLTQAEALPGARKMASDSTIKNAIKETPQKKDNDKTEQMFKDYSNGNYPSAAPSGPMAKGQDATKSGVGNDYAKGGPVKDKIKDMPLKEIIKMLASHPGLAGEGAGNGNAPMKGMNMRAGGDVMGQHDPDAMAKRQNVNIKREAKKPGLMHINSNVDTYAGGGLVDSDDEVENNDSGSAEDANSISAAGVPPNVAVDKGILKFAAGGALEADNIAGYGPDGTPIIQNADGSESSADINSFLGRPKNAPTLGTGAAPVNGISKNASNSVGNGQMSKAMAKGGSDGPPPGSLKEEVADDIPARLSAGEFVFSADVVRFYGLQKLNAMMEFAREELKEMEKGGSIKSPGDNKKLQGQGMMAQFMQDEKPNMNAYSEEGENEQEPDEDDDMATGLLKECMGGEIHAADGGGISEEHFAAGGSVGKTEPAKSFDDMDETDKRNDANQNKHEKEVADSDDKNEVTDSEIQYPNQPKKLKKGGLIKMAAGGYLERNDAQSRKFSLRDEDTDTSGNEASAPKPDPKASQDENGASQNYKEDKYKGGVHSKMSINLRNGGQVGDTQYGRDNMVSAHPKGGSVVQDYRGGGQVTNTMAGYAKGGVVSSSSTDLTPKKFEGSIPMGAKGVKAPRIPGLSLPKGNPTKVATPKMNRGGLLRDPNLTQSYIGA